MKQKKIFYFLLVALFFFAPSFVSAATEVGGNFFDDQHWVATSSPYIIKNGVPNGTFDGVGMAGGATLTIDPGVVIKFEAGTQLSSGSGIIKANGTADNPIIFTALTDDTAGGDTNGDGASTTPAVAYWNRIVSGNDDDEFEYVQIRYATRGINGSFNSPDIKNSIIENCTYGIDFTRPGSGTVIENNTIKNNKWGIYVTNFTAGLSFSSNNIYDNSEYGAFEPDAGGAELVDLSGNWWGDASGPFNTTLNPTGTGNAISDNFILTDFLASEVVTVTTNTEETNGSATNNFGGTSSGQSPPPQITPPVIEFFEATPEKYKEGGEPVKLSWKVDRADFVSILPIIGEVQAQGLWDVSIAEPTTFKLVALGPGGEKSTELFVDVAPRDPVVIVPGILGSWNGRLDPLLNTYEGLMNGLKSVGYVENETLFRFPYEWINDNKFTARLLDKKIQEILQICRCEKVDIVAHSMGGLVSRYYMQNIDDQHVDQLIFIGTPHLGSPSSYLAWEAGQRGNELADNLLERVFVLNAHSLGYKSVVKYIHQRVQSVKQLLPIFSYLKSFETGELYDYKKCREGVFVCNEFLEDLSKTDLSSLNARIYNIVNDKLSTIRSLVIEKGKGGEFWQHGKPVNYPSAESQVKGPGDGTVPINSARWSSEEAYYINTDHRKLPYYSQTKVTELLIGEKLSQLAHPEPYGKILIFRVGSPVDISVVTPDGNENTFYSGPEDPEFIIIPEPVEGEYTVEVIGTGTGEYELEVALLGDGVDGSRVFQGTITLGEKQEFIVSHNAQVDSLSELEKSDVHAPKSKMIVKGVQVSENRYVPGALIGFEATDESKVAQTLYSLDSGQVWTEYSQDLALNEVSSYEILYYSVDEHGNEEYANIENIAILEPLTLIEEQENDIIEPQTELNPTSASSATGEVLGIKETGSSYDGRVRVEFILLIILASILFVLKLKKES